MRPLILNCPHCHNTFTLDSSCVAQNPRDLAEVTVRILDFILKQPIPVSLPKLNKLFWKDCRPPYDMDACIKYLVDTEQIVKHIYSENVGTNQRITTILASPEAMEEFVRRMSPLE